MSFLSAAFLFALPLVAVPVIIHLYRGRQRDVILWGAMQFLASAVTKGRRTERLEELLLMALRLAAVAALVLALARPMVRSSWLGSGANCQVILILDNSLSMCREVDGQSPNARLHEKALDTINSLSSSDSVQVLLAAGNEWATADDIAADGLGKRRLTDIVAGVEPTLGAADLLTCLQSAVHLQADDQLTSRRILVFTDGQAKSWQTESAGGWRQLAADQDSAKIPISIEAVDCGLPAAEVDNLAVTEIRAARSFVRPGEEAELSAEIKNMGAAPSQATSVEWLVGDRSVGESAVKPLQPHGQAVVKTMVRMEQADLVLVTCRIKSSDQVALDQEDSIVVEVVDQLPILFVETIHNSERSVSAGELFAAALGFSGNKPQPWHSLFRPEVIRPAELANHPLTDYRAVVINNLAVLEPATVERLNAFVRAGGALWLALGDQVDKVAFNRDWYSDGDGLSPLAIESLEVIDKKDDAAALVHPPSRDHAATMQLANTTQLDIDEARVTQRWRFADRPSAETTVSTLLESGNGRPLVVENYVGAGRVLVQAFPLGLEWSNLPLLKSYVVMVHDWLNYATAPTMARYNLRPGAPIVIGLSKASQETSAELITPRGRTIPLTATDADFAPLFRFSQTRVPGTYHLRFGGAGSTAGEIPFHVARDATESDLKPLSETDRANLLAIAGLRFDGVGDVTPRGTETAPRREPFWGALLAALVALLAGELLVSNWLARQRQGLVVHAT